MVLISQSSVDWASLPKDPEEYQDIFQQLFEPDADQSYFQKLLPADLEIREFLQPWLKDSATREILDRLANSTPLPVVPALFAEFEYKDARPQDIALKHLRIRLVPTLRWQVHQ